MTTEPGREHPRLPPWVTALPRGSRVLVTGGSGFIGTNLMEALAGHAAVLNIDVSPPRLTALTPLWSCIDLRDRAALHRRLVDFQPDVVLHAAARTDLGGRRIADYDANTLGIEALLDALDQIGFAGQAVFFSSMLTNRPGKISSVLGEGTPDTCYGESKLAMEDRVRKARLGYRHVVVRPTSIWGPWFAEPYHQFFDAVLRRRYVHLARRTAVKTFGYVGNTVYQTLALVMHGGVVASPVYLGDAPPVAIEEWANEIAAMAGVRPPGHIPELAARFAAVCGDGLSHLGLHPPLTTRRLRNMTHDNIIDLAPIAAIAPDPPFSRAEGTRATLDWLRR